MFNPITFVQDGKTLEYTPTVAAVAAGTLVIDGGIVGVAINDIPVGVQGSIAITGVWKFPKDTSTFDRGDTVYWDATAGKVTSTSTDNTAIGKYVGKDLTTRQGSALATGKIALVLIG